MEPGAQEKNGTQDSNCSLGTSSRFWNPYCNADLL